MWADWPAILFFADILYCISACGLHQILGFCAFFFAVDIVIDLTVLCNMVPVEIIFARIFPCRPPPHGRYCSVSCPSSCPSVATLACPVRAPGYNAPLIRFLISALYICLLVYIVCFPTCGFSSLFPYLSPLSFPLRIDLFRLQAGCRKRRLNLAVVFRVFIIPAKAFARDYGINGVRLSVSLSVCLSVSTITK